MTGVKLGHPILADLFRHNLWANLMLIDFCAALPGDVLETNVPGTFGGVRETLTHLVGAEDLYLPALIGGPERRNPTLAETNPDLATVRERARQSGECLVAYAESVEGDPVLHVTWRGEPRQMPVSFFLVQAINHATEHRTQVKTALTQAGIEPPELDGWNWDATRRSIAASAGTHRPRDGSTSSCGPACRGRSKRPRRARPRRAPPTTRRGAQRRSTFPANVFATRSNRFSSIPASPRRPRHRLFPFEIWTEFGKIDSSPALMSQHNAEELRTFALPRNNAGRSCPLRDGSGTSIQRPVRCTDVRRQMWANHAIVPERSGAGAKVGGAAQHCSCPDQAPRDSFTATRRTPRHHHKKQRP